MFKLYKPLECDALDLRLKRLGYSFSATELVGNYVDSYNTEVEKQSEEWDKEFRKQKIESLATGKPVPEL